MDDNRFANYHYQKGYADGYKRHQNHTMSKCYTSEYEYFINLVLVLFVIVMSLWMIYK